MTTSLQAASPEINAAVLASAGTGKTWLLVTRMIRLLLSEARPGGILAVTFTRKAAAEMLTRLNERLLEYADLDDIALTRALSTIGLEANEELLQRARGLYEVVLFAERPIRATTFHAFCQEILQRFPLEADIPPGFELIEATGMLSEEAWEALYQEATGAPDGPLAAALETLFDHTGGLHNTQEALNSFLAHRSDWWAYTEGERDPVAFAAGRLGELLQSDPQRDYAEDFFSSRNCQELQQFAAFLSRHVTSGNQDCARSIQSALESELDAGERLASVRQAFFTKAGEPRKRKQSKAQQTSLGIEGEELFLQLHGDFCERIAAVEDLLARARTQKVSSAWFVAGARLVEHFQRIKREQRCLDFADLEWKTCELLNQSDNAHWVQYKLDQRIDHFLIDEFQDTNPTQWRLLLPLLEELAAGNSERQRSVFLVGDDKQSIYRFRRADPRLLQSASQWLRDSLRSDTFSLDDSWRSSPVIIECVNAVFSDGPLRQRLASFERHGTHRSELWGRVEVLPLATVEPEQQASPPVAGLRDPLQMPRPADEYRHHDEEGRAIARKIGEMMAADTAVQDEGRARALRYSDIFILLRSRTHVNSIERALRDARIPYLGAERGTLLSSLEVDDLDSLLRFLMTPFDNLALAQVLRSPLFAAGNEDLSALAAASTGPWLARLDGLAARLPSDHALSRAQRLLNGWRALAGRIPVHDLLDRIYSEGEVLARYESAFPPALRPRVRANLVRFIELALEVDSGRYPSLPRFLSRLRELKRHTLEAPDQPPAGGEDRVRILTIHASKGLEAPVVFLADTAARPRRTAAYQPLIDWPTGSDRPRSYLLPGRKDQQDSVSRGLLQREEEAEMREDANLLYVALTRARQYLIISGSESGKRAAPGWYEQLRERLEPLSKSEDDRLIIEFGSPPILSGEPSSAVPAPQTPDPRLTQPLAAPQPLLEIAPSRRVEASNPLSLPGEDGRTRGIAIHRMLELLTSPAPITGKAAIRQVAGELRMAADDARLQDWWEECEGVIQHPSFGDLFVPPADGEAYNEVSIQYRHGERLVYGIIDRVVKRANEVLLIDYKTHTYAEPGKLDELATSYREQMYLYARGAAQIWPELTIKPLLLFTACRELYPIALE